MGRVVPTLAAITYGKGCGPLQTLAPDFYGKTHFCRDNMLLTWDSVIRN